MHLLLVLLIPEVVLHSLGSDMLAYVLMLLGGRGLIPPLVTPRRLTSFLPSFCDAKRSICLRTSSEIQAVEKRRADW